MSAVHPCADAVLAITLRHYSPEVGLVLDAVRRRGAALVSLVDSLGAPTVPASAATVQFTVDSPSFPSVIGAMRWPRPSRW